jgi:hypothetical protein
LPIGPLSGVRGKSVKLVDADACTAFGYYYKAFKIKDYN